MTRTLVAASIGLTVMCATAGGAVAQTDPRTLASHPTLNFYGLPGLMDMPSVGVMPDGTLATTVAHFASSTRGTLSFQVLPSVTATLRYSVIGDFFTPDGSPPTQEFYFDRSFDLHWQAIEEGGWWPAVAVGIRDVVGTGIYGGEYVVAARHFGARDQLAVTGGVGWGRLGQRDPIGQPFGTRPPIDFGQGGSIDFDQFFRGDAALFGGIEYQATDRLRLQVEYSSDLYTAETAAGLLEVDSPFNFGATYRLGQNATLGAHYLYGNTVGLSFSLLIDPRAPAANTLLDAAPNPVAPRPPRPAGGYSTEWTTQPGGPAILRDNVDRLLDEEQLDLLALNLDERRAVLRLRNARYGFESQALGRAMRVLSITMPNSVEVFEVIFVADGLEVSRVRMNRADIEALEHAPNGAAELLARAEVEDATRARDPELIEIMEPGGRFTWGISPYIETALFDPSAPVRGDIGIRGEARYEFGNGFVADGELRARVAGNLDEQRQVDPPGPTSPYPVRTDQYLYNQQSDVRVERLTFSHYGRPGTNLYSRVTAGYLERMYAGISGELLWQPVDSRVGLGIEVNHVWQREFDGGFGLMDYDVTMGHVSAYFDLGQNFEAQVDAGRYLAGDYGATFRLERVFNNGWRVGAFATFTDVSFDDFGEGSFDKGITLDIPIGWTVGTSTRQSLSATIRPVLRDGGATLNLDGRLDELVSDYHRPRLEDTQGMIWR